MQNTLNVNVFIWKEPDLTLKKEVFAFIKDQQPIDKKVVVLYCDVAHNNEDSIPLIFYIYLKCQQFKVLKDEKLMFLNPKDFCQAAELCLERLKLQKNETEKENLIQCHESYKKELQETNETLTPVSRCLEEFTFQNNCIDVWKMFNSYQKYRTNNNQLSKHVSELKFLILGAMDSYIFKEIMSFLNCETIFSIVIETPLNASSSSTQSSAAITAESFKVEEFPSDEEKPLPLEPATQEFCKEIITAFLSLLINSRNELAISKVMISPLINLSHEAFTHLKHLALQKEMPMCQTAVSYVTRVRLGGKGYAPPENCLMLPHLKCLELFVDTLNQLQTIVEEDLSPKSAIKRLINTLKKKLIKCESDKLKQSAIEKVSEKLHSLTDRMIELAKSEQYFIDSPQICQETLNILHYLVNYVNCTCSTFNPEKLLLQRHCKRTPINLPPLLGYFRSPEEESTSEEISVINEDSIVSNSSSLGYPPPFMSYFHNSDNSCSSASAAPTAMTPTKINFKDFITQKEESAQENRVFNNGKRYPTDNGKRSVLSNVANIDKRPIKKIKTAAETKQPIKSKEICSKRDQKKVIKKTNLAKKFKLIEGQGKITSFFSISPK